MLPRPALLARIQKGGRFIQEWRSWKRSILKATCAESYKSLRDVKVQRRTDIFRGLGTCVRTALQMNRVGGRRLGIQKHCRQHTEKQTRRTHMHALPISGMESEVAGMISATNSMKTVNESSTVIPVNRFKTKKWIV